jgi:hypothetical protein
MAGLAGHWGQDWCALHFITAALYQVTIFSRARPGLGRKDYLFQLDRDLAHWQATGLIDSGQAEKLRGQAGQGVTDQSACLTGMIPIMAALAIGLGVLAIIASNWSVLVPVARIGLVLAVMIAPLALVLRRPAIPRPLMHDLTIGFSAVLFGGLLVTIGQSFHTGATTAEFLRIWAIGAMIIGGLVASPSALFVAALLLVGYSFAPDGFINQTSGSLLPGPPLLSWVFAGVLGVLVYRQRAGAAWHGVVILLMLLISNQLASWVSMIIGGWDDAFRIIALVFAATTGAIFIIVERSRRSTDHWGLLTAVGWTSWAFALAYFIFVITMKTGGDADLLYLLSALAGLLIAAALIGYGGLVERAFIRVAGIVLFIAIAVFMFVSVGGLLASGILLILSGAGLIALLKYAEPVFARLAGVQEQ